MKTYIRSFFYLVIALSMILSKAGICSVDSKSTKYSLTNTNIQNEINLRDKIDIIVSSEGFDEILFLDVLREFSTTTTDKISSGAVTADQIYIQEAVLEKILTIWNSHSKLRTSTTNAALITACKTWINQIKNLIIQNYIPKTTLSIPAPWTYSINSENTNYVYSSKELCEISRWKEEVKKNQQNQEENRLQFVLRDSVTSLESLLGAMPGVINNDNH